MPRFLVIHKLPDVATQDEVIAAGKAVIAQSPRDTRWLRSWIVPADDHLLCEWEAVNAEAIRTVLKGVELLPIEAIHAVESIAPVWFAE